MAKVINGAIIAGLVAVFVGIIGLPFLALCAFSVMLAFGILHSYYHQVPAVGFWVALVLTWAVRSLIPTSTQAAKTGE
jgi:hypothetical protein